MRRAGVIALGIVVAALLMVPGPASGSGDPPPVFHFVLTQNANGTISFPIPCHEGKGLDFTFLTPVGGFHAFYCKITVQHASSPPIPPFNTFALELNPTPFGIVSVTGTVVCQTVLDNFPSGTMNTAWERDLVQTSNNPFIPVGSGLFVELIDGNWPSFAVPAVPPDQIAAFQTGPPGSLPCPPTPLTTQPVTSGGVILH